MYVGTIVELAANEFMAHNTEKKTIKINHKKSKMKKAVCLLISLFLLSPVLRSSDMQTGDKKSNSNSVTVLAGKDLYELSSVWASEYNSLNPGAGISVRRISEVTGAEDILKDGNVGIVTGNEISFPGQQALLACVAGRDVIVPVINAKNPYINELNLHGVSPALMGKLLSGNTAPTWGDLLKTDSRNTVKYVWVDDNSLTTGINTFLGTEKISGIKVNTTEELIAAVKNDPFAVGFCKIVNVIDFTTQTLTENVKFMPIDRNENGIIDSNENIYSDLNAFTRGVWIGKYPKDLISNIYALTSNNLPNESASAFLKWILTDGQKYLNGIGYSDLLLSERQSAVDRINIAQASAGAVTKTPPVFRTLLLILAVLLVLVFSVDLIIRYTRKNKNKIQEVIPTVRKVLSETALVIPKGLYFDKTHTWAFMEQNGVIKVGIDDFLQHVTGTITRVKMKKAGEIVKKGDVIMSVIRNGKQLNLYAPVSGVILEQNKSVEENSAIINSSPYSEGWIYRIEPSNWARENQLLFMAEKHKQFIITEFTRLRDFLAGSLIGDSAMYAQVILQDGGELMDAPLSDLDPEVWEDFQTKFIDPSKQLWFYEMY